MSKCTFNSLSSNAKAVSDFALEVSRPAVCGPGSRYLQLGFVGVAYSVVVVIASDKFTLNWHHNNPGLTKTMAQ